MNFQEKVFEELGNIKARLHHVETGVHAMKKSFPKWAITGGFLAGIVVSFGHHLMGCTKQGQLTPEGTLAVDSAVCALDGYLTATHECAGDWGCVEQKLIAVAAKCTLSEEQARQVISAHLRAEFADSQYVNKDSGQ